ncbi:pitrilysin family protein [Sulfurimonas sp.]|uniref:M16 family metallopeptidase n=1 Tax=Sulfurimonas sp. TaxID=2022749 RepID=UPI002AB089D2|nr:pitrilysin family protein [Sulfurimonas sp.]
MKYLLILLMTGQMIMATTIQYLQVDGLKIPLIYEEDKRLPLATMQFIFQNSGSITDTKKAGLARFSARVMSEGTKKLGSSAFAEVLESKAIHISASAGKETFVVEVGCLKGEFTQGLKYFDALLKDPNFSDEVMSKIETTTIGSLSAKANDFDYVASNELKAILFKGTPLANPSSGTIKSVESINLDDVKGFVKEHLVSSRLIVVLGGDIDINSAKLKIKNIIKAMPKGEMEALKHYEVSKKATQSILKRDTKQAYVYFGSPYNMRVDSEDYYKARVATFILGTGGFGSRLMEEIRVKKGLAYSAYARVSVSKSSSYMTGYLQTKLESLEDAQKTVKEVVAKFVKDGVTKEELEQTKKFLLGSEPLRVETMGQRLNRTFMEFYKGQELGHSAQELKKIKKLKLKDLNEFIKSHKEILEMSFAIVTK